MNGNSKIPSIITIAAIAGSIWLLRRSRQYDLPATLIKQYDMSTNEKLPLGYRSNNPLNIIYNAGNGWKGKVTPPAIGKYGTYERFSDMAYGYRAGLFLLRKYIQEGYNTVRRIISRWAPEEHHNNTQKYISDVCSIADLNPDEVIDRNDAGTLTKMAYAMSICENGNTEITREAGLPNMEIIMEGWRLL